MSDMTVQNGVTIVDVPERLDEDSAREFSLWVTAGIDREPGQQPRVVLDAGRLSFISSHGLTALVTIHTKVRKRGGTAVLCGVNPLVREALHLTRLDRLFDMFATQAEARAAVG